MLGLLTMLGCDPFGPWDGGTPADPGDPTERVVVSPATLDFGTLSVNADGFGTLPLTIYNLGTTTVTITGHDEPLGSEAFVVAAPPVLELEPGAELDLSVRYTPTTEESDTAQLLVEPSGETVALRGVGTAPVLTVGAPTFDNVVVGCTGAGTIPITNTGSEPLEITGATLEDDEFVVTRVPDTIGPGETDTLEVAFTPGTGGEQGTTLLLASNDPAHPEYGLSFTALGYTGEGVTESFRYTPSNPTDILFLVATGGGMTAQLDKAEDVLSLFVDTLRDTNIDYQLAALSGSSACPSSTPGWADRADTSLQAESLLEHGFDGASGPWDDDLLGLAIQALEQTGDDGCLQGFRRSNADLHLIVVSDGPSFVDPLSEAASIDAQVGAPALYVSALVPTSSTCGTPADDYVAVAERYGGTVGDLCAADWTETFLELADPPAADAPVRYPLAEVPVPSSIEVRAEGLLFSAWSYDEATNEVVFDGETVPALGAEITLQYVSAVACE